MRKSVILLVMAALLAMPLLAAAQNNESQGNLDVQIWSCTELECANRQDVFLVGQYAYIDYNSSVKGLIIAGSLKFPDGSSYQIMFPNRITSNTTGNFTIDLIAWKEGYNETFASKVIQFVDQLPASNTTANDTGPSAVQNPPTFDVIPILAILVVALAAIGVWRYSHRKVHHKRESKRM
jgi:hypothetical protein